MEQKESNTIVTNNNANIVANDDKKKKMEIKDHQGPPKPMKKRGPMHLLRVALFMLRRKSKKSMHIDLASKVLGSMRRLHLQTSSNDDDDNNNLPRPLSEPKDIEAPVAPPMIEQTTIPEEDFTPPASPAASNSIPSSSSMDSLSQYASAMNLQELDTSEEAGEDLDDEYDDCGGDEMLEVKADEFINQFYEQMRIQNIEYMNSQNERKLEQGAM